MFVVRAEPPEFKFGRVLLEYFGIAVGQDVQRHFGADAQPISHDYSTARVRFSLPEAARPAGVLAIVSLLLQPRPTGAAARPGGRPAPGRVGLAGR
jgi:hypothetical protein